MSDLVPEVIDLTHHQLLLSNYRVVHTTQSIVVHKDTDAFLYSEPISLNEKFALLSRLGILESDAKRRTFSSSKTIEFSITLTHREYEGFARRLSIGADIAIIDPITRQEEYGAIAEPPRTGNFQRDGCVVDIKIKTCTVPPWEYANR